MRSISTMPRNYGYSDSMRIIRGGSSTASSAPIAPARRSSAPRRLVRDQDDRHRLARLRRAGSGPRSRPRVAQTGRESAITPGLSTTVKRNSRRRNGCPSGGACGVSSAPATPNTGRRAPWRCRRDRPPPPRRSGRRPRRALEEAWCRPDRLGDHRIEHALDLAIGVPTDHARMHALLEAVLGRRATPSSLMR